MLYPQVCSIKLPVFVAPSPRDVLVSISVPRTFRGLGRACGSGLPLMARPGPLPLTNHCHRSSGPQTAKPKHFAHYIKPTTTCRNQPNVRHDPSSGWKTIMTMALTNTMITPITPSTTTDPVEAEQAASPRRTSDKPSGEADARTCTLPNTFGRWRHGKQRRAASKFPIASGRVIHKY